MRIDPALRALRSNPASQRIAQTALEKAKADWCNHDVNAAIIAELSRYGGGADLVHCPALRSLVLEPATSADMIDRLVRALLPAIAQCPLSQVPFRHQYAGAMAIMQLAAAGEAAISLILYERRPMESSPQTVCFTDSERHEIVLAGEGALQIVRRENAAGDHAQLSCRRMLAGPGHTLSLGGMLETKFIERVADRMVILRLSRTAAVPQPSLEFRLGDGALVHRASGSKADSRHEMLLSLLGRMGRTDAVPVMAQMSRTGSDHVRWQALRECLTLDTARGFSALSAIVRDPGDTLCAHAATLRRQLIAMHPQLAMLEKTPCPV